MSINCILTGNKITEHDLADELMLPVQNGGLYINSETTEEDKAEAQANLEGLGVIIYEKGVINKGDITSGNIEDILINNNSFVAIVFDTVAGMPYDSIWIVVHTRIPGLVSAKATNIYNGDTYMKTFVNSSWQEWKRVNSDYFLPLDGSVPMSGNLTVPHEIYVSDGYIKSWDGEHIFGLKDRSDSDGDSFRQLVIMDTQKQSNVTTALRFMNVTNNSYANGDFTIFGEHNKPSGSYTGNGSSASRDIDTGGIGNVVSVWSENASVIINNSGAFVSTGSTSFIQFSSCKVLDGVITLTTTNSALNENGVEYWYQVL